MRSALHLAITLFGVMRKLGLRVRNPKVMAEVVSAFKNNSTVQPS